MTAAQALSFAVIGITIAIFAWGRFRYDLVALGALLVGVVTGDVSPKQAFTGFTSDVVVIIACALVISAAIARSGIVEHLVAPLLAKLKQVRTQVPVFAGATALLSMMTKNVGALAILMPVALRTGRSTGTPASALLMPMSFMSLLGGLVTLPGTSTNIIVSQVREETIGHPFAMFDFAPVGLVLTALGLVFVSFGYRLLPRGRQGRSGMDEVAAEAAYSTEARIPDELPEDLVTVGDLDLAKNDVKLTALLDIRGQKRQVADSTALVPGEILLLEGEDEALARLFNRLPLVAMEDEHVVTKDEPSEETRSIEAVVQSDSRLIGSSARRENLQQRYGLRLIAVGRSGERLTERLREIRLRPGDVLILRAGEKALPEGMRDLGLLPLAERMVKLGDRRQRYGPALILAAAILLVAFNLLPVAIAFFAAAVLSIMIGGLSTREAYASLEPDVLVLIGALTPLSEAVQHSGGSALIAHALVQMLHGMGPLLVLGTLMVTAMACSPFLHNAPTVLVLGPIAVGVAKGLHLNPDPFLMAVATGAGCDFLTPIGHQCNTLVMGPGGYHFGDYWRLGLPLSLLVILVGTPLIAWVWPLVAA